MTMTELVKVWDIFLEDKQEEITDTVIDYLLYNYPYTLCLQTLESLGLNYNQATQLLCDVDLDLRVYEDE